MNWHIGVGGGNGLHLQAEERPTGRIFCNPPPIIDLSPTTPFGRAKVLGRIDTVVSFTLCVCVCL